MCSAHIFTGIYYLISKNVNWWKLGDFSEEEHDQNKDFHWNQKNTILNLQIVPNNAVMW